MMMMIHTLSDFGIIILFTLFCANPSAAIDNLSLSQSISGNQTLVSTGQSFTLGFFTPRNSNNLYLGLWFSNIPNRTVVWVANRDNPVNQSTATLKFGNNGNLIIVDQSERVFWSSNITSSRISINNTILHLLNNGNLVLRDARNNNSVLWQSFDFPTDALLAGMKLGWDESSGITRVLTAWADEDDPTRGPFTYSLDREEIPQFNLRRGNEKVFRSGLWNGLQFSGILLNPNPVYLPRVIINSREVYYEYGLYNESTLTMFRLSSSGVMQRLVWNGDQWLTTIILPRDRCDGYNTCGPNAECDISDLRSCRCLTGYTPRSPRDWDIFIRSGGCVRRDPLDCAAGDGFIELMDMKMPDLVRFWKDNNSMTIDECRSECLRNCSCTAYANPDSTGRNSGCLIWFDDLTDLRLLQQNGTEILYLRASASDLPIAERRSSSNKRAVAVAVPVALSIGILLLVASCIFWKRKLICGMCLKGSLTYNSANDNKEKDDENMEISIYSWDIIEEATKMFAHTNKIGEGGFGPVYKGMLPNGQDIAVKRLSLTSSGQGVEEFKNEVNLIAKLQHRNLVKLLGCCIHGNERMLVYEYMSNGSLDSFIFGGYDESSNHFLMWRRRFDIIVGIARGLLYLHRDSRLRIIHRDLKASNVLLDVDMNPKISDFGTARAFGGDQLLAKTVRVIGTYGYMSPEYAIDGIFSVKSDVFSFGVLVLEIVSGKRNRQFRHPGHDLNLLGHAWRLWTEGKSYELMDPMLVDSLSISEVVKCVQVGLLCVQQKAEDRPEMSTVLLMLDSVSVTLPLPNQPGFFTERSCDTTAYEDLTKNEVTNTLVTGR